MLIVDFFNYSLFNMYFKSDAKERSGSALCSPMCATSFSLHVLFLDYVTFLRWPAVRREPWSCELLYWIIFKTSALRAGCAERRNSSKSSYLRKPENGTTTGFWWSSSYADAEWSTVEVKSSRETDKWQTLYSQLVINRGRAVGFSW